MAIQLGILDRLESLVKLTRLGDPLATLTKIVPFTLFCEVLPTREPCWSRVHQFLHPYREMRVGSGTPVNHELEIDTRFNTGCKLS